MKNLNILLIEDNTLDARLIKEMLREITHFKSNLISVATLKGGSEQIQKNNFDIILLDLNLPDSSGQQTFQKIIDCSKELPVILITGNEDEELSLKLIMQGAQDYITKQNLNPVLLGKSIFYSIERQALLRNIKIQNVQIDRIEKERILIAKFPSQDPGPVLRVDLNGKLLYINEAGIKLLPDWQLIINEIIPSRMKDIIDTIFIEGTTIEFELCHRELIYLFYAVPFIEEGYINLYGRDITDRKQAEEEIKRGDYLRTILLDKFPIITLVLKKHTREIVACNKLAIESGAVIGKTCYEAMAHCNHICPFCKAPDLWETGKEQQVEAEYIGRYWEGRWVPFSDDLYVHYIFDITDRKLADETIRNLARFPSENPDPVLRIDRSGQLLFANEASYKFLTWKLQIGKKAPSALQKIIAEVVKEGIGKRIDTEHNQRVISFNIVPVMEAGYANLYGRDITERKRAENILESQHALLKALINSTWDIIIFSLDRGYCYTTFNENHHKEMKRVWNADIKIGMNLLDCMQMPELRELAKQSIDRALKGEVFSEIQHHPELDIYYEFNWNPVYQNEEIVGVTSFIRDITNRKKVEEALKISETMFRELFENMKSGSAIFTVINDGSKGSDYIIKKINCIGLKMEGKALEEVVGKRFIDIRPTIDSYGLIPIMKKVWETGKSGILPIKLYTVSYTHLTLPTIYSV